MADLTAYEKEALREIDAFKHPTESRLGGLWRRVSAPLDRTAERALGSQAGAVAVRVVEDVVALLNGGAHWTVRPEAILAELRARGLALERLSDVRSLGLEEVDRAVAPLRLKYQGLAVAEGAGSGLFGGLAVAADIALLVGLALRAANEYATYYGFDVSTAGERLFVVRILAAASSPTAAEREQARAELSQLGLELRGPEGWRAAPPTAGVHVTRKLAEALAVRLVKAKLGQLLPLVGIAVATGYNAWLVGSVVETAYQLYRERFLIERHGDAILPYCDD